MATPTPTTAATTTEATTTETPPTASSVAAPTATAATPERMGENMTNSVVEGTETKGVFFSLSLFCALLYESLLI